MEGRNGEADLAIRRNWIIRRLRQGDPNRIMLWLGGLDSELYFRR
jgi:hypothetical protein